MRTREVPRDALLERIYGARPSIIGLFAPSGFGKSTLARQYLAQRAGRLCDCADARDDLDLARRLLPEHAAKFVDGSLSAASRVELALEAWPHVSGTIVIENADRGGPGARAFLSRLFSVRPDRATIIICARDAVPFHLTRFASPHEMLVLRAADLAFDASEVRALFGDRGIERQLEQAMAVSRGWPVAVSMLNRIVNERRGGETVETLARAAFDELRDYIADDVLAGTPARVMQALFACAAIPRASAGDLDAAFGDAQIVGELNDLAKYSPFVMRGPSGTFEIHPLIAMLLVQHQEDRRAILLRDIALVREETQEFVRAAELHAARGDQHAAARVLAKHEVLADRNPSETYRTVLRGIDRAIIARYPRLWAMTALARMFRVETERLADEAESIQRTLPPDVSAMERFYVVLLRVVLASHTGSYLDAIELIELFAKSAEREPAQPLLEGYQLLLRAMLQAGSGAYTSAEEAFGRALASVGDVDLSAASALLCFGADIARGRGERALEVQFLERALERAHNSGLPNIVAQVLAEEVCGAWFGGDKVAFAASTDALESWTSAAGITGFTYLLHCARGRRAEPTGFDVPRSVIYGRLIALGATRDGGERIRLAEAALSAAVRLRQPFLEALAASALGECDELRFADCRRVAWEAASRCESAALSRAVSAVAERRNDLGMLGAFVENIARGRSDAPPPISLDILAGRVRIDGSIVALSGRELELLVALALRRESTSRSRLATLLWPDFEEPAARNALSVCLHRLRRHLRRSDAVTKDGDGYRLHDDAVVDLWEIDRAGAILRARERPGESERLTLERAWTKLREEPPSRMEQWEWFEPTRRRLRSFRIDAAHRLSSEALECGDTAGALQFAQDAAALDPCDEAAHETIVRAHLLAGDRAAALRAFRRYRETLREELGAEPSEAIAAMVSG